MDAAIKWTTLAKRIKMWCRGQSKALCSTQRVSHAREVFPYTPQATIVIQNYKVNEKDEERDVLINMNSCAVDAFFMG